MGVPGYFKWLIQHCPGIQNKDIGVDCLYVDMNGILHPACHNDGNSIEGNSEEAMFSNFCLKLDEIIFATQPRKLIYFAFDGPAPNAKMVQQRSRRFCSRNNLRIQCKLYNKLAKEWRKDGMPVPSMPAVWDSNNITPGTPFMMKVRKLVESYISERISDPSWQSYQDVAWLLSDSSEPGEGEHKLIQFMKKQRAEPGYDQRTTHCLVGMDADLIQLALSVHDPNILIFRDEMFISINMVREYFRQCFSSILNSPDISDHLKNFERLLDDLLLCFCFVGNDFLPPLPQMKISSNTIGRCLSIYISELPQIGEFLTNAGEINQRALAKFVKALSHVLKDVQDPTREIVRWYDRLERNYLNEVQDEEGQGGSSQAIFWSQLRRRTELYTWHNTAKVYYHDPVCVSLPGWQERYYKTHWSAEKDPEDLIKRVNNEYLRGLQWVQRYYHTQCPDWEWFYPYRNGPSLDNFHPDEVEKAHLSFPKLGLPLYPLQQLLIVVPREGAEHLLPRRFVNFMHAEIAHYFPDKFEIDYSNCPPKWMVHAILPEIDLSHIRMVTEPWMNMLSPKEKKICERKGERLFVNNNHRIAEEYDSTSNDGGKTFETLGGHHGIAGKISHRKTSRSAKKISKDTVRFQFRWPDAEIKPIYLESPPETPTGGLIHDKNSVSPLSHDPRLNWQGMNGFSYPAWGVSIDSAGKLLKPEKADLKAKLPGSKRKKRFRFGDHDDFI